MTYIDLLIDADPEDILNDAYTFLQANIPGWTPNTPNLDVWLLQAISSAAAELKSVASAVPTDIFRWFGASLVGLPPIDATAATATISITVQDNLGYTIPNGTQVSIDLTGDVTVPFRVVGDQIIAPGTNVINNVPIVAMVAGAQGSGLGSIGGVVHLLDPLAFVTGITQSTITTGGVDAEDDITYLNRLQQQLTLLAPRPILPADFAIFARNIAGVQRATALDGYNPIHNLLTANEASAETDATGWQNDVNANVTQTAAQAADGTKSISLSSIAAGDMSAVMPAANGKTVNPGDTVTGIAFFRTAVTARNVKVGLRWLTAANAVISTSLSAAGVNDSAANFATQATVTAVAPATAAKVVLVLQVVGTGGAAEVHYADKMSVRRGSSTDWVAGGTPETGNPRMVAEAAIDALGNPVSAGVKAAIAADAQARREINFVVSVIDPTINLIDVTYQIKALPGYDLPTLVTAVNAAITSYLSPATWGTSLTDSRAWNNATTIRYLELAQVINSVQGVDYITTTAGNYDLQVGLHGGALARVDMTMGGVAALPQASTLTGTAT